LINLKREVNLWVTIRSLLMSDGAVAQGVPAAAANTDMGASAGGEAAPKAVELPWGLRRAALGMKAG